MYEFAINAEKNGIAVIIAGAGGSAHLPRNDFSLLPLYQYWVFQLKVKS